MVSTPSPPLTVVEAAGALRAGRLASVDLVRTSIARADALDDRLGVYVARFDADALAAARRADDELAAGIDRGLLHGIPVGIKDIVATAAGPTTGNSLILDPAWGEGRDAVVVERLQRAGAVITGKASTMELAIGMPDPEKPFALPRNPWNLDCWPGGSSSGSGAGVAAGMFLMAIGTDTGGSIRCPAAFCGVSGLMPTYGLVPTAGCVPLGWSLDHVGPLARSAHDCGVALAALAGPDPRDPAAVDRPVADPLVRVGASLRGLRIGVERAHHFGELDDPAVAPAFEAAVDVLAGLGATVVDVTIPHYAEGLTAAMVTTMCEAFAYHRRDMRARWGDYFAGTRDYVGLGALLTGADYVQAQRVRRVAQRSLARLFDDVDAIVMPTATTPAPTYAQVEEHGLPGLFATVHVPYWNAVGNPVLAVPMGFTAGRLPLSLQVAARPFQEAVLVGIGAAYQRETDWHLCVAPLAGSRSAEMETT